MRIALLVSMSLLGMPFPVLARPDGSVDRQPIILPERKREWQQPRRRAGVKADQREAAHRRRKK